MGVSTDGILCFGVAFEDGYNFPWWPQDDNEEDGDQDFDDWWAAQTGIAHPPVPFSDESKPAYHAYWDAKRKALETCPVELVNYCSCDCPMYILAARDSVTNASRGYPEEVDLPALASKTEQYREAVKEFCRKYKLNAGVNCFEAKDLEACSSIGTIGWLTAACHSGLPQSGNGDGCL